MRGLDGAAAVGRMDDQYPEMLSALGWYLDGE